MFPSLSSRCRRSFDSLAPSRGSLRIAAAGSRFVHARKTPLLRSGFSNLLLQALARVTQTFILVRVGVTQAAHFGGALSLLRATVPAYRQLCLLGTARHFNAGGKRILNR